ncbi:hypothetical protein L3Q65_13855 [Amycolatopsis sp. FU40]|uniref:hypothetical protein n=1 Tax=Amycolatopsis sp. FU40 TaxID=2914159 RepID=UPI001F217558|nr:hypothetical protein [Amycolatopsis sp. FU40]UKD57760.1 hypothetical protein L3Q65_13855 [Amycolatopsis sp. FU40]
MLLSERGSARAGRRFTSALVRSNSSSSGEKARDQKDLPAKRQLDGRSPAALATSMVHGTALAQPT